jgi:hypothetical protein
MVGLRGEADNEEKYLKRISHRRDTAHSFQLLSKSNRQVAFYGGRLSHVASVSAAAKAVSFFGRAEAPPALVENDAAKEKVEGAMPVSFNRRGINLPFSSRHAVECLTTGADKFGWSRYTPAIGSMKGTDEQAGLCLGWSRCRLLLDRRACWRRSLRRTPATAPPALPPLRRTLATAFC